MKTETNPKQIVPTTDFVYLSNDLNKAIYMLHYVNDDEIYKDEIKEVCLVLHKLSQRFFDAYQEGNKQ